MGINELKLCIAPQMNLTNITLSKINQKTKEPIKYESIDINCKTSKKQTMIYNSR